MFAPTIGVLPFAQSIHWYWTAVALEVMVVPLAERLVSSGAATVTVIVFDVAHVVGSIAEYVPALDTVIELPVLLFDQSKIEVAES